MESFAAAIALEDSEFDLLNRLVSGEADAAGEALATTTNPLAFLDGSGVNNAITRFSATGATHSVITSFFTLTNTTGCGVNSGGLTFSFC